MTLDGNGRDTENFSKAEMYEYTRVTEKLLYACAAIIDYISELAEFHSSKALC